MVWFFGFIGLVGFAWLGWLGLVGFGWVWLGWLWGKNTLYGIDITEVSECKLIYQKYWFSSKKFLKDQRCVPSQNPTNHPKELILSHQLWCTKMKNYEYAFRWLSISRYINTVQLKESVNIGVRLTFISKSVQQIISSSVHHQFIINSFVCQSVHHFISSSVNHQFISSPVH